ncbi:MAG: hypothetical protein IT286_00150, partial [Proteobacteria bacterium]|nr:hypothetical protein [Pseudomonadota bacterium]
QKVTNVLLLIIAVLMMIQIGNSSSSRSPKFSHDELSGMGAAPSPTQMFNPHVEDGHNHAVDAGPAANLAEAQKQGFNFQNMVFAALRCPSDGTISLADVACRGKDVEERRKFVDALAEQNLPPRMMFDKIIEKFGEKALSDEALEIRKNNRR